MAGPLSGVRVIELGGIGPGPFGGMLLADLGADVVRVDRAATGDGAPAGDHRGDVTGRGKRSILLDLKLTGDLEVARQLVDRADVLIDPFRPGVAERLGLGPDACLERNPRLVYARMTGWGQDGPLSHASGHDLNYIALAGALHPMGDPDRPPSPPLNLVGDYGGGGMLLGFGVACALFERERSGRGQVIDVAMLDGVARATWPQWDRGRWPQLHTRLEEIFASRTLDEWRAELEGTDVCFAPSVRVDEAARHPHVAARRTYVEEWGVLQPAPSPRFDRTPGAIRGRPPAPGEHTAEIRDELAPATSIDQQEH